MYAPPAFRIDDEDELLGFIEARRFATLAACGATGPVAALAPVRVLREAGGRAVAVEAHLSRRNPFLDAAAAGGTGLALVHGPDGYVSPSAYASKREHGRVVPTWNYIAVEVRGALSTFGDAGALREQLTDLTDALERGLASPWAVTDAPEDYLASQIAGVVGVRLSIEAISGVRKLSQNRSAADRRGVREAFRSAPDADRRALAELMPEED